MKNKNEVESINSKLFIAIVQIICNNAINKK